MPNCDFYALAEDAVQVLDFVFAQPGWLLHELSSLPDAEVRTFRSTVEVRTAFRLGSADVHLQLHAAETRGSVDYRRIQFRPGVMGHATFRYATGGWGLIQLYFGHLRPDGLLTASHTNHFSEVKARLWAEVRDERGPTEAWDWPAVARVSGRLVRHIRKLGSAKHGSRPILAHAYAASQQGRLRLHHA